MKLPLTQYPGCARELICESCRATGERGERFRASMAQRWDVPDACPLGKPMGFTWPKGEKPDPSSARAKADTLPRSDRRGKVERLPGVGDHLADIIAERGYAVEDPDDCGCGSLQAQMNKWGPDGCRERMGEIVDALAENADKLQGWRGWVTPHLPGAVKRAAARGMVSEAIARGGRRELITREGRHVRISRNEPRG